MGLAGVRAPAGPTPNEGAHCQPARRTRRARQARAVLQLKGVGAWGSDRALHRGQQSALTARFGSAGYASPAGATCAQAWVAKTCAFADPVLCACMAASACAV